MINKENILSNEGLSPHADLKECIFKIDQTDKNYLPQDDSAQTCIKETLVKDTSNCDTKSSSNCKTHIHEENNVSVSSFVVDGKINNPSDDLLKKKRKVKYNLLTKRFEFEGEEDKIYNGGHNTKNISKKIIQKFGKELKTYDLSNPSDCRVFQLDSFLYFKKKVPEQAKDNQCVYKEVEDITKIDMNSLCKDIQAILINPPWKEKDFTMEKLKQLQLPLKAVKEGIIFIWVEKEYISDVLQFFEDQNIKYVENLVWARLTNLKNKKSSNLKDFFDIRDMYVNEEYEYFAKSKLTLLLFRKFQESSRSLELRHQRSSDAVFDLIDENNLNYVPNEYAFKLIETLLPKANFKENSLPRMIEIWGKVGYRRKGWIHVVQIN